MSGKFSNNKEGGEGGCSSPRLGVDTGWSWWLALFWAFMCGALPHKIFKRKNTVCSRDKYYEKGEDNLQHTKCGKTIIVLNVNFVRKAP